MSASSNTGPGVVEQVLEYWSRYGGFHELAKSPYIYLALALLPLTYGSWSSPGWWGDVLSILPSLMGVSLAAFTLFLGAGSEGFREVIAGSDEGGAPTLSPFVKTATVFLHFLVVQFIGIVLALVSKSFYALPSPDFFLGFNLIAGGVLWAFSYFVFLYALSVVLAASFAVYEVVCWFDDFVSHKRMEAKKCAGSKSGPGASGAE